MAATTRTTETLREATRFCMPSGMAQVHVRLVLMPATGADAIVGRLWDISHKGGCLAIPGFQRIVVPCGARLELRDPLNHQVHHLEASLRWSAALSHSTFVGMLFLGGTPPQHTFLADYMRGSWTDGVPASRFRG